LASYGLYVVGWVLTLGGLLYGQKTEIGGG